MKTGKEFWDDARNELQISEVDYVENVDLPDWPIHDMHKWRCDDLSRRIAVETGQAKEIATGIIQFKEPHVYYVGNERHSAIVGDRWKPEICR